MRLYNSTESTDGKHVNSSVIYCLVGMSDAQHQILVVHDFNLVV